MGRLFFADEREAIGLLTGGAAIAALGIYDDLEGAGAREKFLVQFAVAGFVYWAGFRIDEVANPFGAPIDLGWPSVVVITGMDKPFRRTFSERDYDRVRQLGAEYRARTPRSVLR